MPGRISRAAVASASSLVLTVFRHRLGRLALRLEGHYRPLYLREAALATPAIPLLTAAGYLAGAPAVGAIAAGAAFAVGFGAARDLKGRRWAAMIVATLGMPIATFVGAVTGLGSPGLIAAAAVLAVVCAVTDLVDDDLWWLALQMIVALMLAGAVPGDAIHAAGIAAIVLLGGGVQLMLVFCLARTFPNAGLPLPKPPAQTPPSPGDLAAHAFRAVLAVVTSLWLVGAAHLQNGYWAPMIAMIILRPGLRQTRVRGLARVVGTVAGGLAAAAAIHFVGLSASTILLGVGLATVGAYGLQKAHYSTLTAFITMVVVLLACVAHPLVAANAEHRLLATLIGGGCALGSAALFPRRIPGAEPAASGG